MGVASESEKNWSVRGHSAVSCAAIADRLWRAGGMRKAGVTP